MLLLLGCLAGTGSGLCPGSAAALVRKIKPAHLGPAQMLHFYFLFKPLLIFQNRNIILFDLRSRMQLSPKNYSHGNKPRFTKGCFPPKNSFGWDFSVSGCDGQIHSFDMNFTPRRFQVGLSSVVYGAFEAAGKTAFFFFLSPSSKNPNSLCKIPTCKVRRRNQ